VTHCKLYLIDATSQLKSVSCDDVLSNNAILMAPDLEYGREDLNSILLPAKSLYLVRYAKMRYAGPPDRRPHLYSLLNLPKGSWTFFVCSFSLMKCLLAHLERVSLTIADYEEPEADL
jgi:hypothetical protein